MADNSVDPNSTGAITVPADLLQSVLSELKALRAENKETKELVNTLLSTKTNRGAFELFPKLPIEIRNEIWTAALNVPRIVGAKLVVRTRGKDEDEERAMLVPTSPNSTLLLVNQESRSQAKRILLKCTEEEEKSRNRVPMLYLNPRVETLWVVNYNWFRGESERMTEAVFTAHKISKLAVPANFYIDMMLLSEFVEDKILELVARFYYKGIKEMILVLGNEKIAEAEDAAFVEPRDVPATYLCNRWCGQIDPNYTPDSESVGDGILPWPSCNRWAHEVLEGAMEQYISNHNLRKDTCSKDRDLTEIEKILVQWYKKEWTLPVIKFLEATTRTELSKLNVPF